MKIKVSRGLLKKGSDPFSWGMRRASSEPHTRGLTPFSSTPFIAAAGYGRLSRSAGRPGVVLILTLMVLIVLATLTYQLTVKLADRRRADDYLIYYQGARYACDSALKYALSTAQMIDTSYTDRAESPDFSDMFRMTDDQVDEALQAWADRLNDPNQGQEEGTDAADADAGGEDLMALLGSLFPADDSEAWSGLSGLFAAAEPVDANDLFIPGPYGPPWPLVTEPIEFEIGSAKITITIEDENAKLPLIWMTNTDQQLKPVTMESLRIFCGWYGIEDQYVKEFQQKLDDAAQIKGFMANLGPVAVAQPAAPATTPPPSPRTSRAARMSTNAQQAVTTGRQPHRTYSDYSKIMASSLIDADWLTIPVIEGRERIEYPMKYLAVWGSTLVNVNTAPRHVLEAAFAFGGDGDKIADAIIVQRQEKPFESIDDLRKRNLAYSSQIQKSEKYITYTSDIFTIRITAKNGPATCMATAAVIKRGRSIAKIAAVFE